MINTCPSCGRPADYYCPDCDLDIFRDHKTGRPYHWQSPKSTAFWNKFQDDINECGGIRNLLQREADNLTS